MGRPKKNSIGVRVSILMPVPLLEEIDALCAANFSTRSAWLLQAAKNQLEEERRIKSENLLNNLKNLE